MIAGFAPRGDPFRFILDPTKWHDSDSTSPSRDPFYTRQHKGNMQALMGYSGSPIAIGTRAQTGVPDKELEMI